MLRLHLLQQLFGLSDFAMEKALFDTPLYRTFAGLGNIDCLPDRVSILRFGKIPSQRQLMEGHDLAKQFFETVKDMLSAKGQMLQTAQWSMPPSSLHRDRPRTVRASVNRKCTKSRIAISGSTG
jgi:IS5 family transposase